MGHVYGNRTAIEYDYTLEISFSDLDMYGHLNSAKYLDLVNTARLLFLERQIGCRVPELVERGIGFYMVKATQEFLRAVDGFRQVRVSSFVSHVEGPQLVIPYEITDPEQKKIYSKGVLEYLVIDLRTKKPTAMPDWVADFFFEKARD